MRAAVTLRPGMLRVQDAPEPEPDPGDTIIAVDAVGVCGSDLNLFRGAHPYGSYPLIQGHEVAGRIIEPGGSTLRSGTPVVLNPALPCRTCQACCADLPNACTRLRVVGVHRQGGLAARVSVPPSSLHPFDPALAPEIAVSSEPVAVALHAIRRSGARPGDDIVVAGGGSIGRAIVLVAVAKGLRVLVIDREHSRLLLARKLGAARTVHSGEVDVAAAVAQFSPGGVRFVIEATGAPAVVRLACDLVSPGGTVVVVGVSTSELMLPMSLLTRKEVAVVGSRNSHGEFPEAVRIVETWREEVAATISHLIPMSDAAACFERLVDRESGMHKVVIRVSEEP